MLTLHKLFFKKFLKDWLKMFVVCIAMIFTLIGLNSSLPTFLSTSMGFFIVFAPITWAIATNNDFQENLDWLINYQYNRKQLISFYIGTQSIKLVLTTLIYISYYFIHSFLTKEIKSNSKGALLDQEIIDFLFSASGFSILYVIFIIGVFIVFFGNLYKSNAELIRRQMIINKSATKASIFNFANWKNLDFYKRLQLIAPFLALSLLFLYEVDIFIVQVLITACIGLFSIRIFNRKFKALSLNKEHFLGISLSIILVLPYFLFVFSGINEITNKKLKTNTRVAAIQFTKLFHTPDKRVLVELISNNDNCSNFYELAGIFGEQSISSDHLFQNLPKDCPINKALTLYSSIGVDNKLVDNIQKFITENNLNDDEQILLAASLRVRSSENKFSQRVFTNYLNQNNTFVSFLGLRMAKRSLSYKKYRIFVKSNFESLNPALKKLGSVKRAIASTSDNKIEKSRNIKSINYDKY